MQVRPSRPGGETGARPLTRRGFLRATSAASVVVALPGTVASAVSRLDEEVRVGLIADLHQDIMHDGTERMAAFVAEMAKRPPDALLQLGDFAYPNPDNKDVIDLFNQAHEHTLHVIGNHDTDSGHTRQQCLDLWGMPGRYYSRDVAGVLFLVLDGNDPGSPEHKGGYASFIGKEQVDWLEAQLAGATGPVVVVSHQPLAGAGAVDNAQQIQGILSAASDKVVLALNGHTHIDDLLRTGNVTYLHVNSASYHWVGGQHQHVSFPEAIHEQHRWISYTCPYRDPLFTTLSIDPETRTILIEGRSSSWVGPAPAELGAKRDSDLIHGEQIAPRIRQRLIRHSGS